MNFCNLGVGFAFIILAIAGVSNILHYAIDEKYVIFAQSFEENDDEERAGEEKNINKNPEDLNVEKLAIITFDDGEKGQIEYAKPILDKYGFPATFFSV
jgi:peptidoglycan/xylan/chitin deacetylase (PgdA/CDA1 family)